MSYPPVFILRHGETDWNLAGRLQGHYDSPLTDRGRAQALAQRRILAGCDLRGCVALSSPQGRALATARIATEGLFAEFDQESRLSEIGLGAWAGRYRHEVLREAPDTADAFDLYELAPGGEGFDALRARCTQFLRSLSGPAILVTHGITSRMLRLILLNRATADIREVGGGQGVVYEISDGRQTRHE
jgi:broad specificity phosphatase PhoE